MALSNTICIICGNEKGFDSVAEHLRDSNAHSVVRCNDCGLMQLSPLPTASDDQNFYDENRQAKNIGKRTDIDYLRTTEASDTKRRADFIVSRFPGTVSVLDVGTGYGFLLDKLIQMGIKANGVEISSARRKVAETLTTAPIFNVNLLNNPLDIGKFDVITMFHVIEHLADPIGFCKAARNYLSEGGSLVIEVPNSKDLMLRTSEAYCSFWWQRAHLAYYNAELLQRVLTEAHYPKVEILGVQRFGLGNMMNWLVNGKPQIDSPSFETDGPHKWLEQHYKVHLESTLQCDTLLAVAQRDD